MPVPTAVLLPVLVAPALSRPVPQQPPPLQRYAGDLATDDFSHSLAFCGDVDGDGCADLALGATQLDIPAGWVPRGPGYVRVFSGRSGALLHVFRGDALGDSTGLSVDGAGDVDGDGLGDVIVGLPNHDGAGPDAGAARVYSGASGALLHTFLGSAAGDQLGSSVAGVGDLDGDGRADLLVGAAQPFTAAGAGYARVVSGASGATLFEVPGDAPHDWFGKSVDDAGDVDGDGVADLVVGAQGIYTGAPPPDGSGYARVLSGTDGSVLRAFTGLSAEDWFGWAVAGVGDVDRDGVPDVAVGAFGHAANTGAARVFSGATGAALATYSGAQPGDALAFSVDAAGDLDLDGHADVLVGAWQGFPAAGFARVHSGASGAVLRSVSGRAAGDGFGRAVAGGGDADADGVPDLLVGSYVGYAELHSGAGAGCGLPAEDYGVGLAGSGGLVPRLAVPGCSTIGRPVSFHVTRGRPGAVGALLSGFTPLSLPFLGGRLLVVPDFQLPSVLAGDPALAGSGWDSFTTTIPLLPALVGHTYYLQAAYVDPAAPRGVSFSAGIRAVVGM